MFCLSAQIFSAFAPLRSSLALHWLDQRPLCFNAFGRTMSRRKQLLEVQQKEVPPFLDYFVVVGPLITKKELGLSTPNRIKRHTLEIPNIRKTPEADNNNGLSLTPDSLPTSKTNGSSKSPNETPKSPSPSLREISLLQSEREFKLGNIVFRSS